MSYVSKKGDSSDKLLYLNIGLQGFTKAVFEIEKSYSISIDLNTLLKHITDSVRYKDTAIKELETLCIILLLDNVFSWDEQTYYSVSDLLMETGEVMMCKLDTHGCYVDNKLEFTFMKNITDNLIFANKKQLEKRINEEINEYSNRCLSYFNTV